jgi:hypothetical protein
MELRFQIFSSQLSPTPFIRDDASGGGEAGADRQKKKDWEILKYRPAR